MFEQFPHSQTSGSADRGLSKSSEIIAQFTTEMDGGRKDDAQLSEGIMVSETKADTSPSSSEDQKQASDDQIELSSKPGRSSKEKCSNRVSTRKKVDALLEEEVSRNNRLKRRNKEIQERLQQVVKLYTSLIERQRIDFLQSRESE